MTTLEQLVEAALDAQHALRNRHKTRFWDEKASSAQTSLDTALESFNHKQLHGAINVLRQHRTPTESTAEEVAWLNIDEALERRQADET